MMTLEESENHTREDVVWAIWLEDKQTFSNHHRTDDGLIGERVTHETATHALIHSFRVEKVGA